ncbi:MAG: short-subunit dehydrogenase [Alphaproteobacteria bacterium]|jgi:short-subunit dehydrogenase
MAYVIIGASGGLGRALADRLAADGHRLILVARDQGALDALAGVLRDRHGMEATCVTADVGAGPDYLDKILAVTQGTGGLKGLLMPIGLALRDGLGTEPATIRELAGANFLGAAEAVTKLWPALMEGGGTVVGFGSITAARGRSRNFVYGAMKRALLSYFESLRLAARDTPVKVQFWVLGFLDTGVMAAEKTPLPKGDPKRLADRVVDGLGRDRGLTYFPGWWRWITLALRLMPWSIYARLAGRGE